MQPHHDILVRTELLAERGDEVCAGGMLVFDALELVLELSYVTCTRTVLVLHLCKSLLHLRDLGVLARKHLRQSPCQFYL